MGCGASAEAVPPVAEKPAVEQNETASRAAPGGDDSQSEATSGQPMASSNVPDSVKRASAPTSGLMDRGYDDQFRHPLALPTVPWHAQLENSASAGTN
jgi:hypothetical protein